YAKLGKIIEGGPTRTESTRRAIAELGDDECDVLFHDAARPLVSQQTIAGCVAALAGHRAVGVAVPSSDTIAVDSDGVMTAIPRRGRPGPWPAPAGVPAVGDPPRLPARRRRSTLRRAARHRRLRDRAALPAGTGRSRGAGPRAQHQDHLPARPGHRRGP